MATNFIFYSSLEFHPSSFISLIILLTNRKLKANILISNKTEKNYERRHNRLKCLHTTF